jgi:hypothetical protein
MAELKVPGRLTAAGAAAEAELDNAAPPLNSAALAANTTIRRNPARLSNKKLMGSTASWAQQGTVMTGTTRHGRDIDLDIGRETAGELWPA